MENQFNNRNPDETIRRMIDDQDFRLEVVTKSHFWFMHFYFSHYVVFPTAEFHKEMFALTESKDPVVVIVAFRGSGKSTICTLSYAIWSILGKQKKKFVVILSQTQRQARQHLINLKKELESNSLLLRDLGPFQEEQDEWGGFSLVIPKYGAKIMAASTEQSIRGLRHGQHRPDLIIADDIEDLQSVKTREGRDKTYNWLVGDIIPAGDQNTKLVLVGNLLHEDSVIMRLKEGIDNGKINGVFKAYPLIDSEEKILWPGKYPDQAAIENEKKRIGSEIAWQREYLLNIVPDDSQVIHPDWIKYYDELPPKTHKAYRNTYAAVDLAISKSDSADYTAVVSALVFGRADRLRIYILPNPIIKKLNFPEQVDLLKTYNNTVLTSSRDVLLVEGVGYQDALPQMLETLGIKATAVKPTTDKRTRLALIAPLIQSGKVKFPRKGAEEIISQITGFGIEKHDDAADALSMLINTIANIHSHEGTWLMSFLGDGSVEDNTIYYSDYVDIGDRY